MYNIHLPSLAAANRKISELAKPLLHPLENEFPRFWLMSVRRPEIRSSKHIFTLDSTTLFDELFPISITTEFGHAP